MPLLNLGSTAMNQQVDEFCAPAAFLFFQPINWVSQTLVGNSGYSCTARDPAAQPDLQRYNPSRPIPKQQNQFSKNPRPSKRRMKLASKRVIFNLPPGSKFHLPEFKCSWLGWLEVVYSRNMRKKLWNPNFSTPKKKNISEDIISSYFFGGWIFAWFSFTLICCAGIMAIMIIQLKLFKFHPLGSRDVNLRVLYLMTTFNISCIMCLSFCLIRVSLYVWFNFVLAFVFSKWAKTKNKMTLKQMNPKNTN